VPSVRRPSPEIDEGPSEEDVARFGDVTRSCPACGTVLMDDVGVCWKCGHDLDAPRPNDPSARWKMFIIVILILAFFGLLPLVF